MANGGPDPFESEVAELERGGKYKEAAERCVRAMRWYEAEGRKSRDSLLFLRAAEYAWRAGHNYGQAGMKDMAELYEWEKNMLMSIERREFYRSLRE